MYIYYHVVLHGSQSYWSFYRFDHTTADFEIDNECKNVVINHKNEMIVQVMLTFKCNVIRYNDDVEGWHLNNLQFSPLSNSYYYSLL